jgi:hypothetical protein
VNGQKGLDSRLETWPCNDTQPRPRPGDGSGLEARSELPKVSSVHFFIRTTLHEANQVHIAHGQVGRWKAPLGCYSQFECARGVCV